MRFRNLGYFSRAYYTVKNRNPQFENIVSKQLFNKIKATGPVTVAEYMKEVLVNPTGGYYMNRDVIGNTGDFITSPELNQMFGEMIAVWCITEWSKAGKPKPFQIVELGPGKGTLSHDILRVFRQFNLLNSCTLNLVEISPFHSNHQARMLCSQSHNITNPNSPFYKEGVSTEGIPVRWYHQLNDVPEIFSIVIAHEFFDVLPIHKFQKTDQGYREILIDIAETPINFRYVLSKNETPATKAYIEASETRENVEVSPESLTIMTCLCDKLVSHGGIALIADYGHLGEDKDTFRGFKNHELHNPLVEPGVADLTADVDFVRLKNAALKNDDILVYGPVTQREFLLKMGIEQRYKKLEEKADKDQLEALKFSYDMMVNEKKMGNRFKFMCLLPAVLKIILDKYPVVGFT